VKSAHRIDVAVIGLGNWGGSLVAALIGAGVPLHEIVVRRRKRSSPHPTVLWTKAALDARILWLCVPDSAISDVAAQIASRHPDLSGQIVVHSSGALTVDALEPTLRAGAAIASVHPAMTFPTRNAVSLNGVLFGVEAAGQPKDSATRRVLHSLVRKLGGKPFDLTSENKALYHAAGTLASPLLVSELTAAIKTARLAGLDRKTAARWVQSLAEATSKNVFAHGPSRSFSGPFARGDAGTIRLHLQALQQHPMLADLYRSLAVHALGALPIQNAQALIEALRKPAAPKSDTQPGSSRNAAPA
jgi:predicted short-subunit dehydrogenase-like oxidoreductase (DUF2520 family)